MTLLFIELEKKNDVVESDPIVSKKTKSQSIGWLVGCSVPPVTYRRTVD